MNAAAPESMTSPPAIPAAATIDPTERSMPAVAITSVIPIGQHADDARLGEDRPEVVDRGERVGLEDRADDDERDDHADERVLLQLGAAREREPPGPRPVADRCVVSLGRRHHTSVSELPHRRARRR